MAMHLAALVIKEFLALLRDPRSRTVIILPPILQLLIFGYAASYDLVDAPLAVYDQDDSAASRELVARFEGSTAFRLVARVDRDAELAPLVDARKALLVLRIDPRFGQDLLAGRAAPVQVIIDGRDSNTAMVASGYARAIISDFNRHWARRAGTDAPPSIEIRSWFNPNLLSRWFIIPGIVGLLSLVVTIMVTALSVAREREQGTFDQLLVTPYRPWEILIGKALPGFIIGLGEATIIIIMAVLWFRIPLEGSLAVLYAGVVIFLLSAIGVGLMISSLAVTQQQGLLGAFLFLVPAIVLSGFVTPIENMPVALQRLTLLNPMRYYLVVVRGVFLEGATMDQLVDQLWPMAIIGVVTLSAATWLFRRRMY